MKFKVGDKVRVKDDADLDVVGIFSMDLWGSVGNVEGAKYTIWGDWYEVYFEGFGSWGLREEMLDIVEQVVLFKETPKQVIFSPSQVTSAAEFLCLNNRYIDEPVEYFEELIYNYIERAVAEDISMIGTAGFYVILEQLMENTVEVTVLVVPDVSSMKEYVEAELTKDNKLVVEF